MRRFIETLENENSQAADDPRFEIRVGLTAAGLFFIGFMGWAVAAPLDAAAFMSGVVTASGGPQGVQSREGGVVQALHVREGDLVRKGDPLVDLAAEDVRTNVRALTARVMARRAEIVRLEAERAGALAVSPWPGMDGLKGEDRAEAERALAGEQQNLVARLAAAKNELEVLRQRVIQGRAQMAGAERELQALRTQSGFIGSELRGMRSLAEKGYAPRLKVSELERSAAGIEGAIGSRQSDVARLASAVGEAQLQVGDYELRRQRILSQELTAAQEDLRVIEPQLAAAREVLRRAEVRSPASGKVFALATNTVGGVVAPGEVLMRIVPNDRELVVEARLEARDAADVRVGQTTQIRFPAFSDRNLPTIHGQITRVSADSYEDQRTGKPYFKVEVRVPDEELVPLKRLGGASQALKPGLQADVMVTLRKRTALQYAFGPLTQSFSRSLHER